MKERTIKLEFSSRQVVIVIALIAVAAILLPISVQASTGGSVNIVDPIKSKYKARVSGSGVLMTGLCSYNLISTPTCATVTNHALNVTGNVFVSNGFVTAATDAIPFEPIWCKSNLTDSVPAKNALNSGATGCSAQALTPSLLVAVTSVTASNNGTTPLRMTLESDNAASCSGPLIDSGPSAVVPAGQTVSLSFPQPYVAPAGATVTPSGAWQLCATITAPDGAAAGAGSAMSVSLVGYMG